MCFKQVVVVEVVVYLVWRTLLIMVDRYLEGLVRDWSLKGTQTMMTVITKDPSETWLVSSVTDVVFENIVN